MCKFQSILLCFQYFSMLNYYKIAPSLIRSAWIVGGAEKTEKIKKSDDEWSEMLTPEEYQITRQKGTERAFTGKFNDNKQPGTYECKCCGGALFLSDTKYDSGSGWPSFYKPIRPSAITEIEDRSLGMIRVEVICSACKSHLGHVFDDGPRETTGLRYCINSVSLDFKEN